MIRYLVEKDRPVRDVPVPVIVMLVLTLALQLIWHSQQEPIVAQAEDLPRPMSARAYVMSSFGEPIAAAKVLNLWLQAFDNQPGISIPLHSLDYDVVADWLDTILELDPRGHYPMLVAARVYGSVSNPEKQRQMMDYIFFKFNEDPNRYWRWLAHAVVTAKHELKDMPLALKYAHALAEKATGDNVPYWARDMKIIVLEDMGNVEAAKILVGGLIASGEITDPYELNFLQNKIRELEEKLSRSRQDVDN
ncbi:MAG: hypothetical protein JSW45_08575 [Thiotrichales bacterium]|nr:MAG: hypothetical protein JSW45_08575 [Thiotrichales bacterium]